MKKFLHSRDGASRGAALIVVIALAVLATALCKGASERAMVTSPDACRFIASLQIVNAGNFYKVGDKLDPVSGTLCGLADSYGFRLQVDQVDSGGRVTGVSIPPDPSYIGYSNPPSNPVSFAGSATGSGFTANCTFN